MRKQLFNIIRRIVNKIPRGKSAIINGSLAVLGPQFMGTILVDGRKFWIEEINSLNRSIFFTGVYETPTTELVKKLVKPGMNVLDVGANFGWYTILMSSLVGPSGRVFAFEISPRLAEQLQKTVQLNKGDNIEVVAKGLADKGGPLEFFDDKEHGSANISKKLLGVNVQSNMANMIRLDNFVTQNRIPKIDFIKCDIDGAEILFLQGGGDIFKALPPMIIEINEEAQQAFGSSAQQLTETLTGYGYRLFDITSTETLHKFEKTKKSSNVLCISPEDIPSIGKMINLEL